MNLKSLLHSYWSGPHIDTNFCHPWDGGGEGTRRESMREKKNQISGTEKDAVIVMTHRAGGLIHGG